MLLDLSKFLKFLTATMKRKSRSEGHLYQGVFKIKWIIAKSVKSTWTDIEGLEVGKIIGDMQGCRGSLVLAEIR